MGGDGMRGGVNVDLPPAKPGQNAGSFLRRQPRCLRAKRRVLLHRHAIMQKHAGSQHRAIATFARMDAHGVAEDPVNMGKIMRAIARIGGVRYQFLRKRLKRRESLGRDHACGFRVRIFW